MENLTYVTYDPATGALTGAYIQAPHESHIGCMIEVTPEVHAEWVKYRANEARDGVELLLAESPALPEAVIVAMYEQAVDQHIDTGARAYGYMSILTAISYAEEPAVQRFQLEGQALRAWRSLCYAKCHEVLAAVKAGARAQPTVGQLLAEMPLIDLPPPESFAA
ncbi:hypothetical protein [Massilia yuzhufengensis]|uniref:Uncharacterized protein n=1 Tax=Massilia yuzhufengensis TaxID=1164594 RepID=A0A1I1VRN4_9BURK|nr:hypothetical protein [Massilia yuzhufengensis]SFD83190.1 hypothetical protein SAMN05216204_1409 [Massilia yuzhufengensis]